MITLAAHLDVHHETAFEQVQLSIPTIEPQQQSLFKTYLNLDDAVLYAKSQLPITDSHKLFTVLMGYHNTLLNQLNKESQ